MPATAAKPSGSSIAALFPLMALAAATALLGGSTRFDAVQAILLRPLCAALLGVAAIMMLARRDWPRELSGLAILLGALVLLTALQLVPLPPEMWQSLPGRDAITRIESALGMADIWRPLSLTPGRTLNALFGLLVPVSALAVVAATRPRRDTLVLAIIAVGTVSAVMGLVQVLADTGYFYAITNRGSPVGFFANRNHAALLGALSLLLAFQMLADRRTGRQSRDLPGWRGPALAAATIPLGLQVLLSGSRAGLFLGVVAIAYGAWTWWNARVAKFARDASKAGHRAAKNTPMLLRRLLPAAGMLVFGLIIAALVMADRVPALGRLIAEDSIADIRGQIWPSVRAMAETFAVLGTGFGSFDRVYFIFEPDALLVPSYVNQAHNDLAQLLIEGGLPAAALLLATLAWLARRLLGGLAKAETRGWAVCWMLAFGFLIVASLVDYPLRTPLLQLVAVWLLAAIAGSRNGSEV